ncbi:MAG: DUF2007 domain-containing protein [Chloroflexota bacterium]|nr:DUF2007 domain-containing protein [Chloroflexota bacterium]
MNLIPVYSTTGQLEAEMVKAFLESQGLKVVLSQESIGRTLGLSAGHLGQVKVLVPESQVTQAANLLDAMGRGDFEENNLSDLPNGN